MGEWLKRVSGIESKELQEDIQFYEDMIVEYRKLIKRMVDEAKKYEEYNSYAEKSSTSTNMQKVGLRKIIELAKEQLAIDFKLDVYTNSNLKKYNEIH